MALAALEIKTKLADHLVTTALGLVAKHSTDYFTLRGADRLFYEVVPNEYHGQLLHQAVTSFFSCWHARLGSLTGCVFPALRRQQSLLPPLLLLLTSFGGA